MDVHVQNGLEGEAGGACVEQCRCGDKEVSPTHSERKEKQEEINKDFIFDIVNLV